ncbi:MAG: UDP-N-acetylmuramoyl-L-alanine--D-glutamate ligase [Anaerolineales bacterium]|nr:UDP-N-acetylmuramoyl-L-alanine--D-glutamate ligase [Anaerolineales bacterium]MDW8160482.1 UDP-N-acetylmuramoyl-L-alanine--D-glutamate ligase [Anaerolineales bacterium]
MTAELEKTASRDWQGTHVLVIGAARQGIALARFFATRGAEITINDRQSAEALKNSMQALADLPVRWLLGGHPLQALDGVDLVCISGGVPLTLPLIAEAQRRGIPLTNDSQLFLETTSATVVGISGSAGKTTTTTLVGRIAQAAVQNFPSTTPFRKVWVGGNIGTPLIHLVDEIGAHDLVVLELSSFQLELMSRSPQIATLLNITPDHLDRHGSMEAYIEAKARLISYQTPKDIAVLNCEDANTWRLRQRTPARLLAFGLELPHTLNGASVHQGTIYFAQSGERIPLLSVQEIALRGTHNLMNVLAACATAMAAGLPPEACREGIRDFHGVAHRLEFVRHWGGADWYNDSIATTPERSMAALRSFQQPIVLLAGGRDKDLPWEAFAELVVQRVRHLILFGEAAEKIRRAIEKADRDHRLPVTLCSGLFQAVQVAKEVVHNGDVVLLSPGATSFDEFRDFEERGECFRKWVMDL